MTQKYKKLRSRSGKKSKLYKDRSWNSKTKIRKRRRKANKKTSYLSGALKDLTYLDILFRQPLGQPYSRTY
jgi:hypothetical protein